MNKKYIVRQNDIKDCGICCLESIIKYYNGYIPLEQLRLDTKTSHNGTTAYNLIKTAKKYGFNAIGKKRVDINDNINLPAIAHIVTKKGLNHFVVIYKISKTHVYIMDPAKGFQTIKREDFLQEWTNIILIFKPYQKIPLYEIKNNLKELFYKLYKTEKDLIKKIIISNFIITFISIIIGYYFKVIVTSLESSYINTTLFIILIFLILNIIKIYLNYIKNNLSIYLNKNINLRIIPEFIKHIINLPLNVISSRTDGEIITRVQELNNIKDLFSEIIITIALDIILSLCSIYFLYIISNQLFLILCIIAIFYIIIGIITSPIIYRKINDNIDLEIEYNGLLSENINNLESIKNINYQNKIINDMDNKYTEYQENTFNYSRFINNLNTIKSIVNDLGLFMITSIGIYLISKNELSLLSLITFNTLLTYFIEPIENTIDLLPKYHIVKLSLNKINEFLNIKQEHIGKKERFLNGSIKFEKVSYTYNDCQNIFKNLNLFIPKNSHIVIKGPSGCGKSTLCSMLNHNINDYKGNIYINDINIKDYSLNTLRSNIVYVSQREKLFTDTIYNNLTLNKRISKTRLNKVLNITKVNEILDKKELRLDSYIYGSGYNLSGGERQRLILARSILLNPQILILDESLSEIDDVKEKSILYEIDKYLKNTTIIYISHTNTNAFNKTIEMNELYAK